ncbi:MAG: L,D-transpeptidase family protein [Gammaproteobacteria bacterium]|nr:L,D-transpeptidase family protein [Gammaproteobacteria bacterium]
MQLSRLWQACLFCILTLILSSCATQVATPPAPAASDYPYSASYDESKYEARLPKKISLGKEKVILVDPKLFAWGAYDKEGNLVRGGIATAGADYCPDDGGPCRTAIGTFRIFSLGGGECASKTYPRGKGGALMPYCMFFHNGESLHGSPDRMLVESNISHGCVHIRIPDAEWLRNNFASVGTKVVVQPY